jgi:GNAT superfamily N-acetyltransferase
MSDLRLESVALDSPTARPLIHALNAELMQRYPEEGAKHFRLDPAEVADGRGAFLIAFHNEVAVGCGAVRLISETDAEIKRMYVTPVCRGQGIGGVILEALEAHARRLGASRLVLEAGERQPEALALYRRAGFIPIPNFGEYANSPLSLCMAKDIAH